MFCILRIMVIRNDSDQAVKDDELYAILKKDRLNVACRPHRVTTPEREVLIVQK